MELNSIAIPAALLWGVFLSVSAASTLFVRQLKKYSFFSRLAVWFVIVPLFLGALYLGEWTFFALVSFSFLACYYELARINEKTGWPGHLLSLAVSVPWLVGAQLFGYSSWLVIPALLGLAAVTYVLKNWNRDRWWNLTAYSFMLGICFSYWIYLNRLGSFRLAFFVFSVVALFDIMAFVFGKTLGRYHPFPRISPNKTLAGYLGGFICAVLAAYIFWFAVPELNFLQITLAGLLITVASTSGDLFGSKIKRLHGCKDFSCMLGPMGGLIDRLDSQMITMGLFYYYLLVIVA